MYRNSAGLPEYFDSVSYNFGHNVKNLTIYLQSFPVSSLFREIPCDSVYAHEFMQALGSLGAQLVQAAKESDSSLATLITTQKSTIENEKKAQLHAIPGESTQRKHPRKKRPQHKKEADAQKTISPEPPKPLN